MLVFIIEPVPEMTAAEMRAYERDHPTEALKQRQMVADALGISLEEVERMIAAKLRAEEAALN